MRLFIAAPLPDEIKDYLFELEKEISKLPAKFKLVSKKNLHLTLKFIPEADEKQIEEIRSRLKTIKFNSFKISLTEKGLFPIEGKAKVIWIGLESDNRLIELQQRIDEKLLDIFSDNQEFKSHITLGRIKYIKNQEKFDEELNKIKISKLKSEIKEFGLFNSTLTKDGPIYNLIERYKLNS
ncbi:MAG: RNA 2',3'-cyclic phosphodiesterase [Nanoarchaeota archaeon]|nr:RNA 2',3'-cyclic phosphodiesterase [Nanoarchaeota archaeon]MBU0962973.1 RNA 2',3'-cyclic phosphodiesterase [Nanoarchaeota archaeon]